MSKFYFVFLLFTTCCVHAQENSDSEIVFVGQDTLSVLNSYPDSILFVESKNDDHLHLSLQNFKTIDPDKFPSYASRLKSMHVEIHDVYLCSESNRIKLILKSIALTNETLLSILKHFNLNTL